MLLFALACTKPADDGPIGGDSGGLDSEEQVHPNVPDEYWGIWQHEGCNDGADTIVYYIGEGSSDADGNFTMTEKWYWFFDDAGWENDCVDTFEYSGEKVPYSYHSQLDATEAEEGYAGTFTKVEDNCPQMNYLSTFDHPDEDDFEYGDKVKMNFVTFFDTLTPSGNPNVDNKMLVFMYFGSASTLTWGSTDWDQSGKIEPLGDEHGPPANYTVDSSICFDG